MKRNGQVAALLLAMVMILTFSVTPLFAAGDQTFKDVPESAWYHGYVEMLFEKGIVKGYGTTGEFRPGNKLTREHAAKMVALAAGLSYQGKKADFPDVDKEGEMSPYIAALEDKGAIQGFPDGTFKPKNNIQRGHAAKIVALAFGLLEGDMVSALTDLPQDADVKTAIEILESNGVVKGYGDTKLFKPEEEISRAEFAKILCIAMVVASIQEAESDPTPENITAAQALADQLPPGQDGPTQDYLQGRLDDLEEEPPVGPGPSLKVTDAELAVSDTVVAKVDKTLATNKIIATFALGSLGADNKVLHADTQGNLNAQLPGNQGEAGGGVLGVGYVGFQVNIEGGATYDVYKNGTFVKTDNVDTTTTPNRVRVYVAIADKNSDDNWKARIGETTTWKFVFYDVNGKAIIINEFESEVKKEEYHTYKFDIEDKAEEYIVSDGLTEPNDNDFEGMTPVRLSIIRDETKDGDYQGKVRVAPVAESNLQLWAKDTEEKWWDINNVGWGPSDGWVMNIDGGEPIGVYIIATAEFDGNVTLKLVDIDENYGATDNVIISLDVLVKARNPEHSEYGFLIGEEYQAPTVLAVDGLISSESNSVLVSGDEGETLAPGVVTDNAREALATALGDGYDKEDLASRLVEVTLRATDVKELDYDKVRILPLEIEKTHGEGNGGMQVWLYASAHDKKWWNIAETGWGSEGVGFRLDSKEESTMQAYVFADTPGIYEITFEAVDTSNPTEGEHVIATGCAEIIVKAGGITVAPLGENYYAAGADLEFAISGLKPNDEVRVGMPIFVGHGGGWPWASSKLVLNGMHEEIDENGDTIRHWVGMVDGEGVLSVSGTVQPDLPDGILYITLPDYGYFIDSAFKLQDEDGNDVHVGSPAT